MLFKRVFTSIGSLCSLLLNVTLCMGSTYTVTYNGNGATSGSMDQETFEVGINETTKLSKNNYQRNYTVSFETNGGNAVSPLTSEYTFNGWLHDTLLTSVTNDMEANWYNISTTQGSSYDLALITLSTTNWLNTVTLTPKAGTRERLYSKPIYMPAGNYGLNFKFCSPSGYNNLGDQWSIFFKLSACNMPQDVYCNDQGLIYTDTDTSAVLLEDEAGSTTLADRNFTLYADGTTPIYLAINCGNLADGYPYEFKFADYTLSLNGKTYMTYADQAATASMVREAGGTVKLKAIWIPQAITLPTPIKEGCTFAGWNTMSDGTGVTYNAGEAYTPTADQTIYAMWNYKITETESFCEGTTYTWEGVSYNQAGTYTKTFRAKEGGDSTRILDLTVLPIQRATISDSITIFDSYTFGKKTITEPGTYNDTLTAESGCDSIVTLNLYHKDLPVITFNICNDQRHEGDYPLIEYKELIDTVRASKSGFIDYTRIRKLTIHNIKFIDLVDSICEGNTYDFGNRSLTEEGTYGDTIKSTCGCCDSIITTLALTFKQGSTKQINDAVCEGKAYTFDGNTASYEAGIRTLTAVEPGANGCDSTTILTLNVLPSTSVQMWDTITVGESYNNYGFNIADHNETGTYTYSQTIASDVQCDSIITLNLVVKTLVDNKDIPTAFSPSNKDGVNDIFMTGYEVYIYDRYGNLICHSNTGWDGTYRGEFADPGVYVYVVTMKDGKKKKGTIEVLKD